MAKKLPMFTASIKVTKGTGVMSRDGKVPFAAGTMFYSRPHEGHGIMMKCPVTYCIDNVFALLADPSVQKVQIITPENVEYIIKKV